MIWILLTAIAVFFIWFKYVRPLSYFTRMGVKQTNPWPVLGDSWRTAFRQLSYFEFIEWVYKLYPDTRYTGFYQSTIPHLLVRDPELIKIITVRDFDHFVDHRSFVDPEVDPIWGGNVFELKGQKWREMRATLSCSFTSSKMKVMFSLMNEAAENFVQFLVDKNVDVTEIELKETFTRYTNDVIATTAFGIKTDSLREPNNAFYLTGRKLDISKWRFYGYMLIPMLFRVFKIGFLDRQVTDFFSNAINETIKMREEQGIIRNDMIHLLLEARKGTFAEEEEASETGFATVQESSDIRKFKQFKSLSNEDIISQALVFFFGGFDTISTAICFGCYELAINKEIQDRLRGEILDTHDAVQRKLSYDVLLNMKYMDMFVSEILRKWPPGLGVDRVTTKNYTIQPATPDEKPIYLKSGDVLFLPIAGLHRDPKYFPDPEKFEPERFSEKNKDRIKPYTYLPFGSGPRTCIASRFALLEIKALLFHLLLHFEIEPCKKTTIPLKLDAKSLNPTAEGGFWFNLKRLHNE